MGLLACGREEPPAPTAPPPTRIPASELVTVQRGTVAAGPLIAGTLEASRGATITAQLGGAVREVGPELGQRVKRGTVLARIDQSALVQAAASSRAQLASAQAALAVARREVERNRALVEAGAIPRRDLELAESQLTARSAEVAAARAQVAGAREQLGDTTVRAPFDGVVARRAVKAGDVVAPGAVLYELIDPSSLRLEAAVPSDRLGALQLGAEVRFAVRGYPDRTFTGTIERISPAADPETRQIPILVEIPNPSGTLLANLFVQGRIATESVTGLVIPASAIDPGSDPPTVLRVAGGEVERVPVVLGLRDPMTDTVIVTRGLSEGDRVIARATAAPAPGTPITTVPTS